MGACGYGVSERTVNMNRLVCRYITVILFFCLVLSVLTCFVGCAERMSIEAGQKITPYGTPAQIDAFRGSARPPDRNSSTAPLPESEYKEPLADWKAVA